MKPLYFACACLLLIGCSTEGELSIHNDSGPDLEVSVDGSTYLLDDGEVVYKRIELGRKFIFGPDDKVVAVRGEGYCKLPFDDFVVVDENRTVIFSVFADAGYIDICNETGYTMELYLTPCSDGSWGDPLELVPDGWCTMWMLEHGCWDMLAVTVQGEFEEYNIHIFPCETAEFALVSASLTKDKGSGPSKSAPAREGSKKLRKQTKGMRKIQ
jgi:hypothetical protein